MPRKIIIIIIKPVSVYKEGNNNTVSKRKLAMK